MYICYKLKFNHMMINKKLSAFTLSELLVVLVIVGILIAIAIPSFMPLLNNARALEARKQLKHVHSLQKVYFYEYSTFTDDLNRIGFEQQVTSDGSKNYIYDVEIVKATNTTYLARATANRDFDQDGIFNVWEINQDGTLTEITRD